MRQNRRLIFASLIIVLLPAMAFAAWQLLFPLHRDPPKVIGVEGGPNGQFVRRIVYERSYRVIGWLPDPEGGHQTRIKYSHFFIETPNSRKELAFLHNVLPDSVIIANLCLPVQNSSLWISAGYFNPGPQIEVVVFDPSAVRTQRTINVSPDELHPGHDFWFENGNTMLRFRVANGVGAYDVVNDKVMP